MDVGHGTGLGLSQVYGFVKQSRGHVKIYSEVGEGTTVKIYLRAFTRSRQLSRKKRIRQLTRGSVLETVLVVEDDADVRSYSCETLRELGYNVLEAKTARSALQVRILALKYVFSLPT